MDDYYYPPPWDILSGDLFIILKWVWSNQPSKRTIKLNDRHELKSFKVNTSSPVCVVNFSRSVVYLIRIQFLLLRASMAGWVDGWMGKGGIRGIRKKRTHSHDRVGHEHTTKIIYLFIKKIHNVLIIICYNILIYEIKIYSRRWTFAHSHYTKPIGTFISYKMKTYTRRL